MDERRGGVPFEIALIDSGINPWHHHVGAVVGGVSFGLDSERRVVSTPDFLDTLGHGTACAGVVRSKVGDAGLVGVKIFHDVLSAPFRVFAAALTWCCWRRTRVVNMSLSVFDERHRDELESLCQEALRRGIILVASAPVAPVEVCLPAALDGVVAVCADAAIGLDRYAIDRSTDVLYACPRPLGLETLPAEENFCGPSFAAAHVTGFVGALLAQDPGAAAEDVLERLRAGADPRPSS